MILPESRLSRETSHDGHAACPGMVAPAVAVTRRVDAPNPQRVRWDLAEDLGCITSTFQYLQASGWYWGSISASEARDALLEASEGAFLVRDSSHPQFMLALSVKTCCGPTSVRIEYSKGAFWLDSLTPGLPRLQSFSDVLTLIQHYAATGRAPPGQGSDEDAVPGKTGSVQCAVKDGGVPLKLTRPLRRPEAFPSLQHLARLAIHGSTDCADKLPLPKALLRYLQDYPFHI